MAKTAEHKYSRGGLIFRTSATKTERDWYVWEVWVDGEDIPLSRVESVEYILHPTFPDRVRRVRSRENHFRLESGGWGEFDIAVNVYLKDGNEKTLVVPLKLT